MRALLTNRAINVRPYKSNIQIPGFSCIGVAERILDEAPMMQGEVYLWHISPDILSLTANEIERWCVDAPVGNHWILSERPIPEKFPALENHEIVLWGPEQVSAWLGNAILRGDLIANTPSLDNETPKVENSKEKLISKQSVTLQSLLDPYGWLTQRGLDGTNSTPVLLEARLWTIEGSLEGPDDQSEYCSWSLIEDPWASKLEIFDESNSFQNTPELGIIQSNPSFWISEKTLFAEASRILEVRRKEEPSKFHQNGPIRSMLLRKWSFNSQTASFISNPAYIPGWILKLPEESKILHGRNGRLYDAP